MANIKKSFISLFSVLFLSLFVFLFAACNEDDPNNNPKSYNVTIEDGNWYDIRCSSKIVQEGSTVTVTVETEPFVEVDKVFANKNECTKGNDGKFTFTMPSEDVKITATIKDTDEILSASDGMYWSESQSELTITGEEIYYHYATFEVSFGTDFVNNTISTTTNGMGYIDVFATNENVIPTDAISPVRATSMASNNWQATAASFTIDLTKIKEGTTTLVFIDTDNDRIISKRITVISGETNN